MITLVTLPCLTDNYAYLLHDDKTGATVAVDVPDAGPILHELEMRGWPLTEIWLTHHHWDHIDGVGDLVAKTGALVVGPLRMRTACPHWTALWFRAKASALPAMMSM